MASVRDAYGRIVRRMDHWKGQIGQLKAGSTPLPNIVKCTSFNYEV